MEKRVTVTQTDVRQIQLAKAALYAGIRLLMDRLGVTSVDRIRLAGAFGSHIDVRYAMALGMIPDCPLDAVSAAGNAAGHGARIALLNRASRREIESVVKRVEKVETAIEPKFQAYFVDAMAIPHGTDAFAGLAGIFPDRAARPLWPDRSGPPGAGAVAQDTSCFDIQRAMLSASFNSFSRESSHASTIRW